MKITKIILLSIGALMISALWSCSSNDDISDSSVPSPVKTTFNQMFPNARAVNWERNLQYYVADFTSQTFEVEAWFQSDGDWAMTETDYDSMVSMLPIEVSSAFNNSQYSSWIVDDVKYYQRINDSFCEIEVETDGMPEISLFYDQFGNLINKVQGSYFDITPNTVVSELSF